MKAITAKDYQIVFEHEGLGALNSLIAEQLYSSIFILVDSNTHTYCLHHFLERLETALQIEIIEIDAGEEYKNLETCTGVWSALSELGADRKSLMINLGGGVVTDLGGFVACTYRRGIDYINIPTTLLAMVDASVGGKTGVDLGALKNQIGIINNPKMVLVDPYFLGTLPLEELRSGYAEMLKHGLIKDSDYWDDLHNSTYDDLTGINEKIYRSIAIKNKIVLKDPLEKGERKILNFGHTLGHAIESYFMEESTKKRLLHGEAIAVGMVLEAFISLEMSGLKKKSRDEIAEKIFAIYEKPAFAKQDIIAIIELLKYDKKNSHGNINFVLLKKIGQSKIDMIVPNTIIFNAFDFYQNFNQ